MRVRVGEHVCVYACNPVSGPEHSHGRDRGSCLLDPVATTCLLTIRGRLPPVVASASGKSVRDPAGLLTAVFVSVARFGVPGKPKKP